MKKIAIIGAGFSGLSLGYMLKNDFEITIFDKSRGVGGRMATRRKDGFIFDHGAPFFTAKTKAFQEFLEPFIKKEIVSIWYARFAQIIDYKIDSVINWKDSPKHYVASPNMTNLAKYLASDMNIILEKEINKIKTEDNKIILETKDEELGVFDMVFTAMPPIQASNILPKNYTHLHDIQEIIMKPCFALMLGFDKGLELEFDAAIVKKSLISWISVMNNKPQRSNDFAISLLCTNDWAKENFDFPKEELISILKLELEKNIRQNLKGIISEDLHKWKYANIKKYGGEKSFFDENTNIGSIGDWCIEGRVEAAFLSALDMYKKIKSFTQ